MVLEVIRLKSASRKWTGGVDRALLPARVPWKNLPASIAATSFGFEPPCSPLCFCCLFHLFLCHKHTCDMHLGSARIISLPQASLISYLQKAFPIWGDIQKLQGIIYTWLPLEKHYQVAQNAWEMDGYIIVCTFLIMMVFLKHIGQPYLWWCFNTVGERPPSLVSTD